MNVKIELGLLIGPWVLATVYCHWEAKVRKVVLYGTNILRAGPGDRG